VDDWPDTAPTRIDTLADWLEGTLADWLEQLRAEEVGAPTVADDDAQAEAARLEAEKQKAQDLFDALVRDVEAHRRK